MEMKRKEKKFWGRGLFDRAHREHVVCVTDFHFVFYVIMIEIKTLLTHFPLFFCLIYGPHLLTIAS